MAVDISCATGELSRVGLRWRRPLVPGSLILGDAWERGYGDLQWRSVQPERILPWSWLRHDPDSGRTDGMGVRVRPAAFCSWLIDEDGISLWLDLRNGGGPVRPGDRRLTAATIVEVTGAADETPWAVQRRLCAEMCTDPLPSTGPVVGCNNWYYAYGRDFTPEHVLRDADTVVSLADGHPVRPFAVVDAGWSAGGVCPGGPWQRGLAGVFDDMPGLAAAISERGARPGIWMRPAALSFVDDPGRLRAGPRRVAEQPLDLTVPDNLADIDADVRRIRGWGFELIKHDFSTYDAFGRFGNMAGSDLTESGWQWADRSLTNAEILLRFYRTIREAAGDAVLIGCNTVGHLAAGLVEVQRIGDDTSGRHWERTRHMGVNSLAFRLAQHGTFFTADADCVACTPQTPWEKNRQFLDLVARSGTALFVSVDPQARTAAVDADLRDALKVALDGGEPSGAEPLDWLTTTSPRQWRVGQSTRTYDWLEPSGVVPVAE
jgi:alpha-galactosidase